ncbi:MarR family winged helix-turn-helix transcriptional regulator [Streptomyces spongiae]|uniref:MarR family transcriptional regulator n=1 Tax=Streptomyces spongiae TaxID=565072 RepID=A0A5N8XF02_9ACTN|nr:MarR family transcriptional regulator [Streptomyces spongiae]MPY58042.1 MarR family transcriptional regulator [Streptomyces spongiae]
MDASEEPTADAVGSVCGLPAAARGGPVSHALSRVARLHRAAAGRLLRGLGLYPGQEMVMMHLWENGSARQSELIRMLGLDPSTVTKMLQRLEQAGQVRRLPDPADRRAVLVEATECGTRLLCEIERVWGVLEEESLAGLSPDEREQFLTLLHRVEANLAAAPRADLAGSADVGDCSFGAG